VLNPVVFLWNERCLFAQEESIEGLYVISFEDKKFLVMSFRGEESFITELLHGESCHEKKVITAVCGKHYSSALADCDSELPDCHTRYGRNSSNTPII
jgi:hypothetical protein